MRTHLSGVSNGEVMESGWRNTSHLCYCASGLKAPSPFASADLQVLFGRKSDANTTQDPLWRISDSLLMTWERHQKETFHLKTEHLMDLKQKINRSHLHYYSSAWKVPSLCSSAVLQVLLERKASSHHGISPLCFLLNNDWNQSFTCILVIYVWELLVLLLQLLFQICLEENRVMCISVW